MLVFLKADLFCISMPGGDGLPTQIEIIVSSKLIRVGVAA